MNVDFRRLILEQIVLLDSFGVERHDAASCGEVERHCGALVVLYNMLPKSLVMFADIVDYEDGVVIGVLPYPFVYGLAVVFANGWGNVD